MPTNSANHCEPMSNEPNATPARALNAPTQPDNLSEKVGLRGILLVAAAARLASLLVLHNFSSPNFFEWGDISRKYLAGRGFSYYTVNGVDVPTAYMPPAYSFLIQVIFMIFGDQAARVRVIAVDPSCGRSHARVPGLPLHEGGVGR